ncbi:hypothetical protein V8G54_031022 [Vigna mungo]|uniref:Uncharacterized protein n=1 Tax=Vigna mungo TaxID=3915 RepID=A0AAQ3MXE9_VIGMU
MFLATLAFDATEKCAQVVVEGDVEATPDEVTTVKGLKSKLFQSWKAKEKRLGRVAKLEDCMMCPEKVGKQRIDYGKERYRRIDYGKERYRRIDYGKERYRRIDYGKERYRRIDYGKERYRRIDCGKKIVLKNQFSERGESINLN